MIWGFVLEFEIPSNDTYEAIQIVLPAYLLIAIFLYLDIYVFTAILIICLPFILIYICYTMVKQK